MNEQPLVVVIMRAQIFHNQHKRLLEEAYQISSNVLVILGSSNAPRDARNPLNSVSRQAMIKAVLPGYMKDLSIDHCNDYDEEAQWEIAIKAIILKKLGGDTYMLNKVTLLGHSKDESSYYLKSFPEFKYHEVKMIVPINSTELRALWFRGEPLPEEHIDPRTIAALHMHKSFSPFIREIAEQYVKDNPDPDPFKDYPYPESLNILTSDIVVRKGDSVLMIKRRNAPFKGRYALPGGHKDSNETSLECALRELKEETGLVLTPKQVHKKVSVYDKPGRDPSGPKTSIVFSAVLTKAKDLAFKPVAGDDAVVALWLPIRALTSFPACIAFDHVEMVNERFKV